LLRNRLKLGPNYKEVVSFLDEDHLRELRGENKKKAAAKKKEAAKKPAMSAETVVEDDEEDPFGEDEPEEGTEQDLRNRELMEDPIIDNDEDEERPPEPMDEDDVLGD
jgi:cohesin complex subunit SA-1/2